MVKFADTNKEKNSRREQQNLVHQIWTGASPSFMTSPGHQAITPLAHSMSPHHGQLQQQHQHHNQHHNLLTNPYLATLATLAQQQQQLAATLAFQQQLSGGHPLAGLTTLANSQSLLTALSAHSSTQSSSSSPASNYSQQHALISGHQPSPANFAHQLAANFALSSPPSSLPLGHHANSNAMMASGRLVGTQGAQLQLQSHLLTAQQHVVANRQKEGPDGSNLFIYHLPGKCK